ncbi:hypothetical protein WJX77_008671 [Trebouxia sp. C0004]
MSGVSQELHDASLVRNKLLLRAVGVITSLQSDTDNLITAADLHSDGALHLGAELPQKRLPAARLPNPQQYSAPVIQIPARFKSTAAGAANSDHAYQRSVYSAAEQRNLLLKRAYDVISNLQTDVDGLVEEVSIASEASPSSPISPLQQGSSPHALSPQQTGDGLVDIMRTAAATSAAAARLRSQAEQAQRQAQEAEESQSHAAEEEAKAERLADQAERRAMQEQDKGNLAAAVAASSTASRLRKAALSAQTQLRQLKARAEMKSREAKDSFALAQAAEEKAQALEAAGMAQAGPFSPLPYSPSANSPHLLLQSPALLRGLAGGAGAVVKGFTPSQNQDALQQLRLSESGPLSGSPAAGAAPRRPSSPADLQAKLQSNAKEEEQAQLLQAAWAQLQTATAAAQQSEEKQSAAAQASQQAQRAAAEVGEKHRAASKAQAQAEKLQSQVAKLKVAGRAEEAKRAQQQAKKWLQTAVQAAQAVEAAEQQEKAASEVAQAAAAASFEAEAQAEKLTGIVKQLQEATEAGVLAATWRKKATEAAQKAIDVQEQAQQHTAQASAAGNRAAAAEEQAQQFEAQGKFADAAAAALQADRWHKAAGDAAKQAAKLQAEAKAAAAQYDAASATAEEAKSLARRLDIKTGHHRRSASLAPEQQMSRRQTDSQTDSQSQFKGTPLPSAAAKAPSTLPNRGQSLRPTGMAASPSRLSRMTIQDPQDNEEMDKSAQRSADGAEDHLGQLSRATSSVFAQAGMRELSSPKQQSEAKPGLRLQLASNTVANRITQDRSSLEMSSLRGGLVRSLVSNDSTNAAVAPWKSNSAAAWVKQQSLEKTQSAAAQLADWRQQEEEEQLLQQQPEPDQDSGIGPASGRGRALGGLHIEVGEAGPQDGLQEWTESGLDDIAAAVAQYTGASPDDLMVPTDDQQQEQEQLPPKQIAQLHKTGSKQLSQSPRPSAGKAHATQQDRTGADSIDAAAVAGAKRGAAPRYANAQEQMEAKLEAAMAADDDSAATGAPVYANAFDQMEAELEAAMAADANQAVTEAQTGDPWGQIELDAAKAADDAIRDAHKPAKKVYATQQEEMDAELEAAMAADAAAANTDTQDSPLAAVGYGASPGGSPKRRNGPRLELPGNGGGIDFDALDLAAPQDGTAGGDPQQDASRAKLEGAFQKWQTSARKAQRYADACYAEAQAKADEATEATAQAAAAQQEAEKLAEAGRHNDAEAATAAAQRWSRRAAKAQLEGDAARSEGDTKVEEAKEAAAQAAQAQQEVQLAGAARNSPLQVPLTFEEPQAAQASSNPASHGNASGLMQEAAEAVHQAELAQQEAQQLQEAGHFAEAAALSTTAHKWRKRAAKVNRAVERARADSSVVSGTVPGSPRAGLSAESSRTDGWADSPARGLFADSPQADSARSPRKGPTGEHPRRGAFIDSLHLGLASDSPRPGQMDTSPGGRGRTVPDWLSSPRSTSAGSKRLTPDSSYGGGPPGSPLGRHSHRASESTSPGAIHRTNVFSHPGSCRVSSGGSAEAVPQAVREHRPDTSLQEDLSVADQAKAASEVPPPEARTMASDLLEEAARWAKRNAKALKLARHAKEAAGASEQEAAAAAEEAERAALQAEQGEAAGIANDSSLALKQAAKWTKRAGKAQRAAARARAEAEAQEAEAAQAAHLAQQATVSHAKAETQAQAQAAARGAEAAAQAAARDAEAASEVAAKARQQADSLEAEVSNAAGQAADAWALVEVMEAKGDAAAAADKAAQAVALQQQYQERQAAADAAASQAQQQELTATSLRSAAAAALQAARAASTHPQLQQQPSHPLQALASDAPGMAPGLLPKGNSLLTDHTEQQLVDSQAASGLDVHADVRHVSYAVGQEEVWSSKHSVATEADQLSSALAGQQHLLREGPNLPWSIDTQADSLRPQEQQLQSLKGPVSYIQSSDAGGSVKGGVEGAGGGQEEAAKAAYRQWSAGFEARMAGKSAQHSSGPRRATHQQLRGLTSPSSLPDKAALVTWESFKTLAKPGDRLRLVGNSLSLAGEAGTPVEGAVMPAGSGMPLVTDGDVAAWGSSTAAGDSTSPTAPSAALSRAERADVQNNSRSAWHGSPPTGDEAADVGDGQCAWVHSLQAASSQAEKLLLLAEVREQEAMGSTQRATELQQLAAGSGSLLESSQLAAAQTASHMAQLARAEAERLSEPSPAVGLAVDSPESGLLTNNPAPAALEHMSTYIPTDHQTPNTAESAGPASTAADDGLVVVLKANSAAEATTAAMIADSRLKPDSELASNTASSSGLSHDSAELIHSLSSEMQAAMQQLIASAALQSSASVERGRGITSAPQQQLGLSVSHQVSHGVSSQPQGAGRVIAHGDSQQLPGMQSTALWTNASRPTAALSHQASSQIPGTATRSFQASTYMFAIPEMPAHTTGLSPRDGEGPSGMQLHLMHQLEELERSVRRVEQEVSSTKQNRRRLKAASLPAQSAEEGSSSGIPYLDGLPLEYWVVPPRTPIIALPSVAANLPGLQRSGTVPRTSSVSRFGTARSMLRQSLNATRHSAGASLTGGHWRHSSSLPKTRLPMSAYATPQQPSQPHTQPKENQQWGGSKGPLPSPRALPNSPPLRSVNKVLGQNRL